MFDYKKRGRPRTDEERAARHARLYPGQSLPPRGSGLRGRARLRRGMGFGNFSNLFTRR